MQEVRTSIFRRVYIAYFIIIGIGLLIIAKALYIQQVEGAYWQSKRNRSLRQIHPIRGTIFSQEGEMLCTSIPEFDIYIDFRSEALRAMNKKGILPKKYDSLSLALAAHFPVKTAAEYRRILERGFAKKSPYYPLLKKISYSDFVLLKTFPLVKEGRNRSGFLYEKSTKRIHPYGMLALRTIGLKRTNAPSVGLEAAYDSILKGSDGVRVVRRLLEEVEVPIETKKEPVNGKDIITTLDISMQEIVHNALKKMMISNECVKGTAIVLEVKTGKVKAIANLNRSNSGTYYEGYNNAILPVEPGSTMKLASMMAVLEDKKADTSTIVDMEGGRWTVNGGVVYDSENHGNLATLKKAFEMSSNVASAKFVTNAYAPNPSLFISHLEQFGLTERTGIDLIGEPRPIIHKPGSESWHAITLPWMSFGYSLKVTPLHMAMLYNAVANNGILMRPYLVDAFAENGRIIKQIEPTKLRTVCSPETLGKVQSMLEGVCHMPGGTAYSLLRALPFRVAGKTGTSKIADKKKGYSNSPYQSSFAGYFPANDPQYTCVVIIENKPNAAKYYGSAVAGPVFKEIAERLYTMYVRKDSAAIYSLTQIVAEPSSFHTYSSTKDFYTVLQKLGIQFKDSSSMQYQWSLLRGESKPTLLYKHYPNVLKVPNLIGLGLKDAIYLCESRGLRVAVKGIGKVVHQSLPVGDKFVIGQKIEIELH